MIVKIIRDGFYDHVDHLCSGCAGGLRPGDGARRRLKLISHVQAATEDRLDSTSTFVYSALAQDLMAALGYE